MSPRPKRRSTPKLAVTAYSLRNWELAKTMRHLMKSDASRVHRLRDWRSLATTRFYVSWVENWVDDVRILERSAWALLAASTEPSTLALICSSLLPK